MQTIKLTSTWAMCCLLACGPQVDGAETVGGSGSGSSAESADVGADEFNVDWAMGFYHRAERFTGAQLSYLELRRDGTGAWHRILCDFSPVEPWEFQWRALSDSEVELYPVEGETEFPTLVGLREREALVRKAPDSQEALVEPEVVGDDPVTYQAGRPCNVPPPREGCPMPGYTRLDDIPICDQR